MSSYEFTHENTHKSHSHEPEVHEFLGIRVLILKYAMGTCASTSGNTKNSVVTSHVA